MVPPSSFLCIGRSGSPCMTATARWKLSRGRVFASAAGAGRRNSWTLGTSCTRRTPQGLRSSCCRRRCRSPGSSAGGSSSGRAAAGAPRAPCPSTRGTSRSGSSRPGRATSRGAAGSGRRSWGCGCSAWRGSDATASTSTSSATRPRETWRSWRPSSAGASNTWRPKAPAGPRKRCGSGCTSASSQRWRCRCSWTDGTRLRPICWIRRAVASSP
mmetsp:Transcript_72153/g.203872  ORF Transcript_72153/g.203872 Transcript_72153/m.203872 type:complete len:214 (-) Transcript_72153:277-918(-)